MSTKGLPNVTVRLKQIIMTFDGFVKSRKRVMIVIPAKAGIQCFNWLRILWTPVFTGETTFYDFISFKGSKMIV
jgi:hypothetical protein